MRRYLIYFIEQAISAIAGISIGCFIVTHKLKFLAIAMFSICIMCMYVLIIKLKNKPKRSILLTFN